MCPLSLYDNLGFISGGSAVVTQISGQGYGMAGTHGPSFLSVRAANATIQPGSPSCCLWPRNPPFHAAISNLGSLQNAPLKNTSFQVIFVW